MNVTEREEELRVVFIEDLVRDTGSVDASKDLDIRDPGDQQGGNDMLVQVADTGGRLLAHHNAGTLLCLCSHLR